VVQLDIGVGNQKKCGKAVTLWNFQHVPGFAVAVLYLQSKLKLTLWFSERHWPGGFIKLSIREAVKPRFR
jgi:hypothetical protein